MFFDFLQKTFTESIDFLFGSEYTQGTKGGSTMPDNTVSLKNNAEKCILIDASSLFQNRLMNAHVAFQKE